MKVFYYFSFFLSIITLFFLYSCDSNPSNLPDYLPGAIKGRILDSATHKPLPDVTVYTIPAAPSTCQTDSAGYYFLGSVPMGSTGVNLFVIATHEDYINDTIPYFLHTEDTATINFKLTPIHGVYLMDNIHIQEYLSQSSNNSLDLRYLCSVKATYPYRDLDLRDSAGARQKFRFVTASNSGQLPASYNTKLGDSLGYFSKSEFDTLAMYYGASEPLSPSNFPNSKTNWFYASLTGSTVYPFSLGRSQNSPIYGLLYIKSAYLDGNNVFNMIVDVKININGQNNFIPNN